MDIPEVEEAMDYLINKATPGAVGVVATKGVTGSVANQTETNNWIIGGVGFFLGVSLVNSSMGNMGKSFGTGIAIGSAWELLNAIISAFTKYASLEELLYSPVSNGNGNSNGGS